MCSKIGGTLLQLCKIIFRLKDHSSQSFCSVFALLLSLFKITFRNGTPENCSKYTALQNYFWDWSSLKLLRNQMFTLLCFCNWMQNALFQLQHSRWIFQTGWTKNHAHKYSLTPNHFKSTWKCGLLIQSSHVWWIIFQNDIYKVGLRFPRQASFN